MGDCRSWNIYELVLQGSFLAATAPEYQFFECADGNETLDARSPQGVLRNLGPVQGACYIKLLRSVPERKARLNRSISHVADPLCISADAPCSICKIQRGSAHAVTEMSETVATPLQLSGHLSQVPWLQLLGSLV